MSAESLSERFMDVMTDIRRMDINNADPMRQSKRNALAAATEILENAVRNAQRVVDLAGQIDWETKQLAADPGPKRGGRQP